MSAPAAPRRTPKPDEPSRWLQLSELERRLEAHLLIARRISRS